MLDFRIETFLTLCETKNYTKTAGLLHITQPAVSQHIKYLEGRYNCKLFNYAYKSLTLTSNGEILRDYAISMRSSSTKITSLLQKTDQQTLHLKFGATLSIGEYVMPKILKDYLNDYPTSDLSMYVDNTACLLTKLDHGEIDFALIEGSFKKSDYEYHLISKEEFIPLCSPNSPLSIGEYILEDLMKYRLIIREIGSGTRSVLENSLFQHSLSLDDFDSLIEIGSFSVIKTLVSDDLGITFAYREVVNDDILNKNLCEINIPSFQMTREFNLVYLKGSLFENYYLDFLNYLKNHRNL